MAIPAACRVCLVDNIKLDSVRNADLIQIYEKLTNTKFKKRGYPKFMCYFCLSMLRRCRKFVATARDANNVLDQWYNNNADIRLAKPSSTCSVSKVAMVSIGVNNVCSEHVITVEETDLEPDSVDDDTVVDLEKTDEDEQMESSDSLHVDNSKNTVEDTRRDVSLSDKDTEEISCVATNGDVETTLERNGAATQDLRDTTELFTENVMTVVKIEEMDEIDTENLVEDETQRSRSSNKSTGNKPEALKPKNKQTLSRISDTKHYIKQENGFYFCNECSYKTPKKFPLIRHIRKHTGEKPFSCSLCDYRCAEKSNLKSHVRIHTGEKPYSCQFCGYKCRTSINLKMHIRTHTREKPFSCKLCDYRCTESSNMKTHVRKHTGEKPFICDTCSFSCRTKSNLKFHLKKHSDEDRPFSCEYCEFTCAFKGNLTEHLRIHTGEKPFKCDICGRRFKRRTHLKGHLEKLHPYHIEKYKAKTKK